MPTPPLDPTTLHCPRCGDANLRLSRRHRRADAGFDGSAETPAGRRYRCRAPDCGWRGSLASQPRQALAWLAAAAGPARRAALGLGLLAAVGVAGGVLVVAGLETWARHATGLVVAQGQSHDGLPLGRASMLQGGQLLWARAMADSSAVARAASVSLSLRQGCAWGQPGRNPYRGSTEQALTAAGLPPEVVRQIAAQRQAGQKVGRLKISREAIRLEDGSRHFSPRQMAMSFGNTLCLNTWVNFAPGHVEPADLFEARDEQGRLHSVMVPDVCGNVTVLGAQRPGGVVAGVSAALADRSLVLAAVADALAQAPASARAVATAAGPGSSAGTAEGVDPAPSAPARPGQGHAGADHAEAGERTGGGSSGIGENSGIGDNSGSSSGGSSSGGEGGRDAPAPLQRQDRATGWADLGGGWLPRTTLIAGLNGSAELLARAGTMIAALPIPAGEPGPSVPSTRQNAPDSQSVPEPGTLLCVLVGLAALAWVGRRDG